MFGYPSALESFVWRGKRVYVKRDDLLHPLLNGNKARKFHSLLEMNLTGKILVSYGGNQSNAMMALSYIAKLKNCEFIYVTPPLSGYLQENPQGNFAYSLQNHIQLEFVLGGLNLLKQKAQEMAQSLGDGAIFIPQGGACALAKEGIKKLALELESDCKTLKNPIFFYTSGSGASAGYLSEFLPNVFSVAVAGDERYLKTLFLDLNVGDKVSILNPHKKIPFGKPDLALYEIYEEWLALGVEFDLIYDCLGWLCLSEHLECFENKEIVFIHSGGLLGNATQKQRYKRLFCF